MPACSAWTGPQLLALRRAINRDIDRLKALPFVDTLAISTRLDNMIAGVDAFPLAMEMRPQPDAEAPVAADGNAWTRFWREAWSDLKQLVRVQQMDKPEMPLLTPSQAFFLRENLKLRLIGARLSLLARDAASYKADLEGRARLAEPLLRHAQQQRRARRRRPAQPARGGGEHTRRRTSPARWRRRARCGSRASARPVDVKALAWIIVLFAVAVGVTLFARYNTGYVLLVIPPWRIEFSLNVLLVALAAAFAAAYAVVRATSATMRLPRQVREYRLARRREQARTSLARGAARVFRGPLRPRGKGGRRGDRSRESSRSSRRCWRRGRRTSCAPGIAATSTSSGRAAPIRTRTSMRVVTEAELLLEQRRHEEALERLKALPRKHTAALRLELKAQQQAHNWERVAALAGELEKRGVFDATQAGQVRRYALAEDLKRKALDTRALEEAWRKVPQEDRTNRRVAAAAAQCFIALGGCARAHAHHRGGARRGVGYRAGGALRRVRRRRHGRPHRARGGLAEAAPEDAVLLLTLGKLCAQMELWGKAQSYLDASVAVESTWSAHLALAQLHERLGNVEAARKCLPREPGPGAGAAAGGDGRPAAHAAVASGRRRKPLGGSPRCSARRTRCRSSSSST